MFILLILHASVLGDLNLLQICDDLRLLPCFVNRRPVKGYTPSTLVLVLCSLMTRSPCFDTHTSKNSKCYIFISIRQ